MQNSVFKAQKPPQTVNSTPLSCLQSHEFGIIPHKMLHRTTWKNVVLNPRFNPGRFESSNNRLVFDAWNPRTGQEQTKRWIKHKKILGLHNWEGLHASVYIQIDRHRPAVSMGNVNFAFEQIPYKTEQLTLSLSGSTIDQLRTILLYVARNQTEIEDLKVQVSGLESITQKGANRVRKTILTGMPNLKSLHWEHCWIRSTDAKTVSFQIIKRLTNLKSLFVNFGGMKIDDGNASTCVARCIGSNLPNLEKLVLYFWGDYTLTNENLKIFAKRLCRKLGNLKHLHLNFRSCNSFDSAGLKTLSNEISQNLVNLRVLILILDRCSGITESDLDTLPNELSSSLPKLRYLSYDDKKDALNVLRELEN